MGTVDPHAALTAPDAQSLPHGAASAPCGERHVRTRALIGERALNLLTQATVAVFGLGGVGSYAAEALARAGVAHFILIDSDSVCESNINRQLIALYSTLGKPKVSVMKDRIHDINPRSTVETHALFYGSDTADSVDIRRCSCIIDAIDTVSAKLLLAERAAAYAVPEISCMGTGNKLDPARFEAADIYETSVCPLARVMRRELKKRGVERLRVVYSKEEPRSCGADKERRPPASIAFVPAAAGLLLASEAVRIITKDYTA